MQQVGKRRYGHVYSGNIVTRHIVSYEWVRIIVDILIDGTSHDGAREGEYEKDGQRTQLETNQYYRVYMERGGITQYTQYILFLQKSPKK